MDNTKKIRLPQLDTFKDKIQAVNQAKIGYYECDTAGNVAAKTVTAENYELSVGGSFKIKMANVNTASSVTLNINNTGAKPLIYDSNVVSATNSWEEGETVDVYYDGTSYYANNVAGGSGSGDGAFDVSVKYPTSGVRGGNTYTLEDALAVLNANLSTSKKKGGMSIKFIQSSDNKYVQCRYMSSSTATADFTNVANWQCVDDEPTAGSDNLVKSGGVSSRLNLLPLGVNPLCIMTTTWDSRNKHWVIPVSGGEEVVASNTIYYAFLTSYSTPVAGETPAFLEGYVGRQYKGGSQTFTVPNGCKYLVISYLNAYLNAYSYININGYNILNGIWPKILTSYELPTNKKDSIVRQNRADEYINAVCLYRKFVNIDSALKGIDSLNLFNISDYGFISSSTKEPVISSDSVYNLSEFISVTPGHAYRYKLTGTSSVLLIAEYTDTESISTGGIAGHSSYSEKSGVYIPDEGVNYVRLSSGADRCCFFADMTEHLYAFNSEFAVLNNAALKIPDLTTDVISKNLADPDNIMVGMIDSNGAIRLSITTWEMIKVDVTPGTVISFGGFNLGRAGYAAFFNDNNIIQGDKITIHYSDGNSRPVTNLSVPEGASKIYIDIKSDSSPENPYQNLMINVGETLLTYEPFVKGITKIKNMPISGADPTLEGRVSALEDVVEELIEQGTTIPDLIADLPVSDGSTIETGYAYIDSTTYNVKVKQ